MENTKELNKIEADMDAVIEWLSNKPVNHIDYDKKVSELHALEAKYDVMTRKKPVASTSGGIEEVSIAQMRM